MCLNPFHRYEETSGGLNPDSINPEGKASAAKECTDKCSSMAGCVGFTMAGDSSVCYFKSKYVTKDKEYKFAGEGSWTDYYFEAHKDENGYGECTKMKGAQTMQACAAEKNEAAAAKEAKDAAVKEADAAKAAQAEAEKKAANAGTAQKPLSNLELRGRVLAWMVDPKTLSNMGPMNEWDTSQVTDMTDLFIAPDKSFGMCVSRGLVFDLVMEDDKMRERDPEYCLTRNIPESGIPDISKWDTSKVTRMKNMFKNAKFDGGNWNLNEWDTSNVVSMAGMFDGAENFNKDISKWNTANVKTMGSMFSGAHAFSGDIRKWNTAQVMDMHRMFSNNKNFNSPIGEWDTSSVESMKFMFQGAAKFNQDISKWKTSKVKTMENMFEEAVSFNQDISKWDTSKVTNMNQMFAGATANTCEVKDKKIVC